MCGAGVSPAVFGVSPAVFGVPPAVFGVPPNTPIRSPLYSSDIKFL